MEKQKTTFEYLYLKEILYYVCKRCIDVILAILGITILSPVFIILSLFYLFGENKGPIFFKQIRIGKEGEEFYIYKFRSMIVDADSKLKSNANLYNKYLSNNYKLDAEEDPRLTNFGRFIRKTSLDELPQLFNVLEGKMSLVGPRPVVKEELNEYLGAKKDRFISVKPGITGYWQINGRSNVGYPERVDLELYYVDNQSVILDLKILFLTFISVSLKNGAH